MAFKLRSEQQQIVQEIQFADYLVAHLKTFSPLHAQVLGDEGLHRMVQLGRERAIGYGLTQRPPMQLYVELLFILGADFDTDPQYPWVAGPLNDQDNPDQIDRANRLYDHVMDYLTVATGPDRIFAKQALLKARQLPYAGPALHAPSFDDELLQRFEDLFPERFRYIGEHPLRQLIFQGKLEAQKYRVTSDAGVTLMIALMFVLGHGVTRDPKYGFVSATLTNEQIPEPNRRAERLFSKTMTYLDHALSARKSIGS